MRHTCTALYIVPLATNHVLIVQEHH